MICDRGIFVAFEIALETVDTCGCAFRTRQCRHKVITREGRSNTGGGVVVSRERSHQRNVQDDVEKQVLRSKVDVDVAAVPTRSIID